MTWSGRSDPGHNVAAVTGVTGVTGVDYREGHGDLQDRAVG